MGKRKERRLAAMSNAGRRVKLDLFAEPSGDLGGSSAKDEVGGGDIDANHRAELPNSPSSSGQPQDPLQLLGQYSDDELDVESNKTCRDAVVKNILAENVDQAMESFEKELKDIDGNARESSDLQQVEEQEMEKESSLLDTFPKHEDRNMSDNGVLKEMNMKADSTLSATDVQVPGDVSSGWKLVLHEESNQYYYWNIETGETSWEVPKVLANFENPETTAATKESNLNSGLDSAGYCVHTNGSVDTGTISQIKDDYGNNSRKGILTEGSKDEASRDKIQSTDVKQLSGDANTIEAGSERSYNNIEGEEHGTGNDLPSRLLKQSEELLERLMLLKGFTSHLQGHDWISKYILEIEIRLADFKSLFSHGSSLLPFWMYSDRQLKRLENAINDEVNQFAKSSERNDDQTCGSFAKENDKRGTTSYKYEADEDKLVSHASPAARLPNEQVSGSEAPIESSPQDEFHNAEDVDMDVDMEVEDASLPEKTAVGDLFGNNLISSDQSMQSNLLAEHPSSMSVDGVIVPRPPDEEWIPPPPPDNEHIPPPPPDEEEIPPPPPDEPPEVANPPPPSYTVPGEPHSYEEQYNLSYPGSNIGYYGHAVAEVPGSSFYGHTEGAHAAVASTQIYYESVTNLSHGTVPVIVAPAETATYYDPRDGSATLPAVSSAVSSGFQLKPDPVYYDTFVSGKGQEPLSNVDADTSAAAGGMVPSDSATIQAPAISLVKENISEPSSTAAIATSSVVTKVQPKATRVKKRTVASASSLRSNKKVSSLVDKWKAAKEELLEDEEEPQNAYEILEKKKQREIEEWRAKHIASGEAKDNANFQPLGGDWRERVKRRRAQLASGTVQTQPQSQNDEKQQPDLGELSRDLPTGWQAYWDDSSRQVYYGNAITSETTWIRPTK